MELRIMDEELIYKMTGKKSGEIEQIIEQMKQRSKRTKEHQRMTRKIFDVHWPTAVKTGNEKAWNDICVAIDNVIEYLNLNSEYFPNYEGHIVQWETLRKVAECVSCNHSKPCDNKCLDDSIIRHLVKVA